MKNLNDVKTRFLNEPFNRRLGHLASDLARIAAFLDNSLNRRVVNDILEESKFFIEWIALDAPLNIQILLAEMQPKLALWQRRLALQKEGPTEIKNLRKIATGWSKQLIQTTCLKK